MDGCSIRIDWRSFDIFHDQIRPAALGVAGIDHVDNRRVIERGEELTLPEKTVAPCGAMFVEAEKLDGYLLFNLAIGSLGQINCAHATRAEQSHQPVWSATALLPAIGDTKQFLGGLRYAICKVLVVSRIKTQQGLDFRAKFRSDPPITKDPFAVSRREVGEFVK